MTFTSKARVQFPCPSAIVSKLKEVDQETLDIPESFQQELKEVLFGFRRPTPEIDAIASYATATNQDTFIILDKFHINWWRVSPQQYWEHIYFCTLIQGAPENPNGVWYRSVGFSPWSGKLHIPENGYTLEQTFQIFLDKKADFSWQDIDKLTYVELDAAVMQYACMASRNPDLKLLVNTKKGVKYVIGNTGGCPVFCSFHDMNKFFMGMMILTTESR